MPPQAASRHDVRVLVEKIENGPITRFQRVRAGHLNQLSRFWKALIIGFLLDGETHRSRRIHYPYRKSSSEGDMDARLVGDRQHSWYGSEPPMSTLPVW